MHRSSASLKQTPSDDRAVLEGAGRGREPPKPRGNSRQGPARGRQVCSRRARRVSSLSSAWSGIRSLVCPTAIDRARAVSRARAQVLGCPAAGGERRADRSSSVPGVRVTPGDGTRGKRGLRGCDGGERREGGAWGRSGPGFGGERGEGPPVSAAVRTRGGAPVGAVALASPPASAIGGAGQWLNLPHSGSSHTREAPKLYTPGPPPPLLSGQRMAWGQGRGQSQKDEQAASCCWTLRAIRRRNIGPRYVPGLNPGPADVFPSWWRGPGRCHSLDDRRVPWVTRGPREPRGSLQVGGSSGRVRGRDTGQQGSEGCGMSRGTQVASRGWRGQRMFSGVSGGQGPAGTLGLVAP